MGPCNRPCNCEQIYDPVCGSDDLTYDNKCTLECVGVRMKKFGKCDNLIFGC